MDTAAVTVSTIPIKGHGDRKYSSHYGVTLNRYFKHTLPAAAVVEWLALSTAGCSCTIPDSNPTPVASKIFCINFFQLFRINFAEW